MMLKLRFGLVGAGLLWLATQPPVHADGAVRCDALCWLERLEEIRPNGVEIIGVKVSERSVTIEVRFIRHAAVSQLMRTIYDDGLGSPNISSTRHWPSRMKNVWKNDTLIIYLDDGG